MGYYDIRDEKTFITAVQRMLRDIRYLENGDASVGISGSYDLSTKDAVYGFQSDYGIEPTGIVDYETWQSINSVHSNLLQTESSPRAVSLFPPLPVYEPSTEKTDDLIYVLQYMLREVGHLERNAGKALSGIYDEETKEAVRSFKRQNLIDGTDTLDSVFLNRLFDEYEVINSSYK